MATEFARAEGIDPLTDRHWQVIRFMRSEYEAKGTGPTVRVLGKTSGVPVKELYQLFPGPAARRQDRRDPEATRLHLSRTPARATWRPGTTREERTMPDPIEKVSIIISKGSLEGSTRPHHGQRRPGRGHRGQPVLHVLRLDAIHRTRLEHIKVAAVGNPGMHMASLVGVLPGMSAIATHMMEKKMETFDIPGIPEFMELIGDTGCGCTPAGLVDLFGFTEADFIEQVEGIITVGEFYEIAAGGQIIFT